MTRNLPLDLELICGWQVLVQGWIVDSHSPPFYLAIIVRIIPRLAQSIAIAIPMPH